MALLKVIFPFLVLALAVNVDGNVISGGGLGIRAAQTDAVCTPDFDWMSNSNKETPCLVAAKVLGSCAGGNWRVPALIPNNHYDNPTGSNATACSCSWSAYNLLSACSACQGLSDSIQNWPPYKQGCPAEDLSNTSYFPPTFVLPTGTLIPAYAAQDPTTWPSQRFDVNAARAIVNSGAPDVSQPAPAKKKTPIGAIVGGVVGGVVIVVLAIGIILYMMRRQRQNGTRQNVLGIPVGRPNHLRQISDQSSRSGFIGLGYAPSQAPPLSPTTLHTHNSSIGSFSQLGLSTAPMVPPRPFTSPSPTMQNASRENIVVPFNLQPLSAIPESPRKGAKAGVYPVYDSPNARPAIPHDDTFGGTSTPPRARVNPPTYNESATGSPPSAHHRLPSKSSDSNHSYETSPGSVATWMSGRPAGTGSISGIGEVMSQVDMDMMSNANQSSSAPGPSRKYTPPTGDRKRRPET